MELRLFTFIDEVTDLLENMKNQLEIAVTDLELYFHEILLASETDYSNINSRLKSTESLKEKILRNTYYKKYDSAEELLSNLSDLIGIRIECRFIEDEENVYKALKKFFNKVDEEGYYYNEVDKSIRLELTTLQPQHQKNGFKIFRIDGYYEYHNKKINFEVQIKSLVNIFWGEIEHKVVYKNNNYVGNDDFMKNILGSIKKNLSMIDNQLLMIDNQFKKMNAISPAVRKAQLETVLSKMIYDIFSTRMKGNIGFIVDFRNSCDTIMKYIFRSNKAENLDDYNKTLITTLTRLNEISKNSIDFDSELKFERDIILKDDFSITLGKEILNSINIDFEWNLFFRILFEIELGNNAEDFETFIDYLKNRFYENHNLWHLTKIFSIEEAETILDELMLQIAKNFKYIDSVKFIYDNIVEEINKMFDTVINIICKNISSYDQWIEEKDIYFEFFKLKTLSIFSYKISREIVENFIEEVTYKKSNSISDITIKQYAKELERIIRINPADIIEL
ncbi:GTP pyrophosphokinase [Clostridium sediminicola]|uniref:GTP pyrophosphokinase n=1 Tax=Clostridium sediminicola TaxID=3114879 RepID=UPI0031F1EFB6